MCIKHIYITYIILSLFTPRALKTFMYAMILVDLYMCVYSLKIC